MNREFFLNIIFLLSINLLIKPFYIFGIDRTVQNTVGTDAYGMYFTLFNFTFLFYIINDFGIQNFNSRNIAQHNHLLDKYVPSILMLKLLLGGVYLFSVFFFGYLSGYDEHYYHLLFLIAINQILVALIFYLRSNIAALGKYRIDSLISTMDKLLMILICSVLLWGNISSEPFQIEWFVYAQIVALSLTALVAFGVVFKQLKRFKFRFDLAFLLVILRDSYPYALALFLMTIYNRIDVVMVERFLPDGLVEAGIYASAYRLLDACNMLGFLFAGLLLPMFAKMIKNKAPIYPLLRFSFLLIWAIAISVAIACYFFQGEIVILLYDEATLYWGAVLAYLMLSFIAVSAIYILGSLLTAKGLLMVMNQLFFLGIVINITLNYWLIPDYKALGAAWATCFTQFFILLGYVFLVWKNFELPSIGFLWIRVFSFVILVILTNYFIVQNLTMDWRFKFFLAGGLSFLMAIALKMIDLKALRQFTKP